MPTNAPCALGPEIEDVHVELERLSGLLEREDHTVPGNAALRLTYLAIHAIDRAGAICRGDLDPLLGDLDDFIYVASSIIDPRGPAGYDQEQQMKGALRAMLSPTLGELGLRVTPEVTQ